MALVAGPCVGVLFCKAGFFKEPPHCAFKLKEYNQKEIADLATDEKEEKQTCENCGSKWSIVFDPSQCDSAPEVCPFCGAAAGVDSRDEDVYDDGEEGEYDESDED